MYWCHVRHPFRMRRDRGDCKLLPSFVFAELVRHDCICQRKISINLCDVIFEALRYFFDLLFYTQKCPIFILHGIISHMNHENAKKHENQQTHLKLGNNTCSTKNIRLWLQHLTMFELIGGEVTVFPRFVFSFAIDIHQKYARGSQPMTFIALRKQLKSFNWLISAYGTTLTS